MCEFPGSAMWEYVVNRTPLCIFSRCAFVKEKSCVNL
jgi:hypothetical protein